MITEIHNRDAVKRDDLLYRNLQNWLCQLEDVLDGTFDYSPETVRIIVTAIREDIDRWEGATRAATTGETR